MNRKFNVWVDIAQRIFQLISILQNIKSYQLTKKRDCLVK